MLASSAVDNRDSFCSYLIMIRKNQLATSNCFYNRLVGENPSIQWADRVQDASSPLSRVNQVSEQFHIRTNELQ